jgi:hypothetical protein
MVTFWKIFDQIPGAYYLEGTNPRFQKLTVFEFIYGKNRWVLG